MLNIHFLPSSFLSISQDSEFGANPEPDSRALLGLVPVTGPVDYLLLPLEERLD